MPISTPPSAMNESARRSPVKLRHVDDEDLEHREDHEHAEARRVGREPRRKPTASRPTPKPSVTSE